MPVFLFSDIEGSTQKWETHKDAMAKALARHDEIILGALAHHGGKVIKHTGDGIFALFEGRQALQCALSVQQEMAKADWNAINGLKVRMALHAGDAEKRGEDYFGPVINRTARILATGWGGQVILTPAVQSYSDLPEGAMVENLGTHQLKDLSDPQPLLGLRHSSLPQQNFPPLKSLTSRPNNLPSPSTSFFGRETELKTIAAIFKDPSCRLVTIIGQGGMGKSRLAIQAAADRLDDFSDGVYFIPLAPVLSPATLATAVAGAVPFAFSGEADVTKELFRFLKERSMLLVMDNFEHLLAGSPFISEMLKAAPNLRILVTSRIRLGLSEEWVLELEGMPFPKSESDAQVDTFGAVKFFANCAQRAQSSFTLDEKERKEVARICQLVDGVPLGIELAAAWARTLSCQEIREEIEKNLDFLASHGRGIPERQQSLRAVFEYSWNLLADEEKKAIRAMSVFTGGFMRDQAEKIAGCSLLLLSALVDKSLLRKNSSGRFEMHEILRQFSAEKLKENPEEYKAAQAKHGHYFCEFLASREQGLKGKKEDLLLVEITKERSNIRAAWEWAVENLDSAAAITACNALFQFYEIKFLAQEGEWAFSLAAQKFAQPGLPQTRENRLALAQCTAREGWYQYLQGRTAQGEALVKKGLKMAEALDEPMEAGLCLHFLAAIYRSQGKFDEQDEYAKKSLVIFNDLKDEWGIAWSLYHMAMKPKQVGDNAKAQEYLLESLELFRKMEYEDGVAWTLFGLGQVSVQRKEYEDAKRFFNESVSIFDKHGNKVSAGWTFIDMVRMHAHLGENEIAFRLAREAYEAFHASGYPLGVAWSQYYCSESAFNMGNWEEALRAGRDALRLFTELLNLLGQAWTYTNLCRTANRSGQFEGGQIYGRKGVETFEKLGDREGGGACTHYLARSEMGLGNLGVAEKLFVKAIENGQAMKIHWRVLESALGLAEVKAKLNRPVEGLLLSTMVMMDPECPKDLKADAAKMVEELKPRVKPEEAKVIQTGAASMDSKMITNDLIAKYRAENKA